MKGWCSYDETDAKGLTPNECAMLMDRIVAALGVQWPSASRYSARYFENREIWIRVEGGWESCKALKRAIDNLCEQKNILINVWKQESM